VSKETLDKDLDEYLMEDPSMARAKLDNDLDDYMKQKPSASAANAKKTEEAGK